MADDDLSATEHEAPEEQELDAQDQSEPQADDGASPSPSLQNGDGGTEAADTGAGWQSTLKEAGFQTFDDVDNAVQALVSSNQQRDSQIQQYADQLQFYQDQLRSRDTNQPPEQQGQPEQGPVTAADPLSQIAEGWKDPQWANQYIEVDEEGNRAIADHVDDETREKILGIDKSMRKWQEVLQDPRAFASAIDQRVEAMIQDRFESNFEQKQTQAVETDRIDRFVNDNASWLYQKDAASGQYIKDRVSGEYQYSDQGQQFVQHMASVKKDGIGSVSRQIQYAQMAMGIGTSTTGTDNVQQDNESISSTAQQQRQAMRGRSNNRTTRQTSFNGVSAESGGDPTGRSQMSFGEETLAAMKVGE